MQRINKQQGMSAILFAMVFAVVLTLLAVGFATLVKRDQRQALDKTLSYQAQYAAETAINRKAAELFNVTTESTSSDCSQSLSINNAAAGDANAEVTCIQWTNIAQEIVKDSLSTDPFITRLKTSDAGGFNRVTIKWRQAASGGSSVYSNPSTLPTIVNTNKPILRITIAETSNMAGAQTAYLIPASTNSNLTAGWDNGAIGLADCDIATDICSVSISLSASISPASSASFAVLAYGGTADGVTISVHNGGGPARDIIGSQATIDANARAQDVTKRISARVSLVPQGWNPTFAASANVMCKDYKVDGDQDTTASAPANPLCP